MNRSTLVMLILVLGLGGFYYFYEVRGGETRSNNEKQEKRLFPEATAEALNHLEVSVPGEKEPVLVLEKKDGRWVRQGPPEQLVSVREVGGMADKLAELQRSELILEKPKPEDLKQFGLDKPAHQLVVKAGPKAYTLQVGGRTPDGSSFYVRLAPDGPVVTVPGTFASILEKSPEALRETSVMPIDVGKAVKFRLLTGGQETELVMDVKHQEETKDEDSEFHYLEGDWKVTRPFQAPADSSKVDAFLNEWSQKKAGRFMMPDEKVDFSHPEVRLEVWEEKATRPQVLEVGPPVQVQPTMRYVRRLSPDEVCVVDFARSELLARDADSFRDRHLLMLKDVGTVEKIEGQVAGHELAASRSGDSWSLSKPERPAGDKESQSQAVSNFLWDVSEAQSTGPAPADAVSGLASPRARITLYGEKGASLGTIRVGALTPDQKGCYVQVEGKPEVGLCEMDLVKRWEETLKGIWPAAASPSPKP